MPLQFVRRTGVVAQETAHLPALQTAPAEHEMPHPPQLKLSVWRSRHVPLQFRRSPPQETVQAPMLQT